MKEQIRHFCVYRDTEARLNAARRCLTRQANTTPPPRRDIFLFSSCLEEDLYLSVSSDQRPSSYMPPHPIGTRSTTTACTTCCPMRPSRNRFRYSTRPQTSSPVRKPLTGIVQPEAGRLSEKARGTDIASSVSQCITWRMLNRLSGSSGEGQRNAV